MKGKVLALSSAILALVLSGCNGQDISSSASSSFNDSNSSSMSDSSTTSGGSDSSSTIEEPPVETPLPENWQGTVRIYYHNDTSDYANRRLWVWDNDVDGKIIGELEFDNQTEPDAYGVYKDIDFSEAPWSTTYHTSISFIIKMAGTWADQSQDVVCSLDDFYSNVTTDSDGRELITIYAYDIGGNQVAATHARELALGDRIGSLSFTDWRTLHVEGTGQDDGRPDEEIGIVSSYDLYGFDQSYYLMDSLDQTRHKNDYLLASGSPNAKEFDITFTEDIAMNTDYILEARMSSNPSLTKTLGATFDLLYDDPKFISDYTYDGDDLGVSWDGDVPTFKVWSPVASSVSIHLYYSGTPNSLAQREYEIYGSDNGTTVPMTLSDHGVWVLTNPRQLSLYRYYTIEAIVAGGTVELVDPYAISTGINGQRAAILTPEQLSATDPSGFRESVAGLVTDYPLDSPNNLTVYEVHIRDFTIDETWVSNENNPRGTYPAFVESGTSYAGVSTGFDSLLELGVNAVQLLPVFDQDNDERTIYQTVNGEVTSTLPGYNWGYNPWNFNVVEGSYSSDPYSATQRMLEYKELVQILADNGIRTIMDVVYNHMSSVGNNAFNKLMPRYYFKVAEDGSYIDETGVHNTFNTERLMASRFVVDSVCFWAEEYGIKGFRFDLMGCIETSTMRDVKDALYDIDPEIVVYGEGWRGSGSPSDTQAGIYNAYRDLADNGKGSVGVFNDCGRDGLKGNTTWGSVAPSYGFMSQGANDLNPDTLYNAATVYLGENRHMTQNEVPVNSYPDQTVNYVSCHDNYTLYDQLNYCYYAGNGASTDENPGVKEATLATTAFVLMSQGIAFIHGGEEILRQKLMYEGDPYWDAIEENDYVTVDDNVRLIRNSYAYGDAVNSYKWDRKAEFKDYFDKYAEACQTRARLLDEGILGVDYDTIQGSYTSDWGTELKYTRCWDDMVSPLTSGGYREVLAVQTEFSKMPSGGNDVYVVLGGRMNGETRSLGMGQGQLEVLYSTTAEAGSTISVGASNTIDVSEYQMMIVRRIS